MSKKSARRTSKKSTSSAAASRAKTSAPPASALALVVLEAASGLSSLESLRRCALNGSSSKTSRAALRIGSTLSEETWEGSAMKAYRSRLARAMSERRTAGTASSSWVTVCARDVKGPKPKAPKGPDLPAQVRDWPSEFPTVTASRYGSTNNGDPRDGRGQYRTKGTPSLDTAAKMWPTVVVTDQASSGRATTLADKKNKMKPGTSLTDALRDWLTASPRSGRTSKAGKRTSEPVVLNPAFCQAMMGFPAQWLDGVSPPSATPSSPKTRRS